jgi:thioredoxin 1
MIIELTDQNFDIEISKYKTPVILDFYAVWCSPCKAIAPFIDEIIEEHQNELAVLKINVEDCPQLSQKFNIASIPTIVFLNKDKEVVNQMVGFHNKEALMKGVYEILES